MWQRLFPACLAITLVASNLPASQQAESAPRVVNVTADSQPEWIPSEELERQARKTAGDYLAAEDGGNYIQAYAFLAEMNRKDQPLPIFSDRIREFNARAGAVMERRITTVTWTKDSPQAPAPGIFVALDLVSRFAKIDRHCGYLVLYQPSSGRDFRVSREESNFMDNATAAGMSEERAMQAWVDLSANCPGYKTPLPEAKTSTIGYPTVGAALAALRAKPGTVLREENGWTIIEDTKSLTIWSFAPKGYPAYPSVVKRQMAATAGGTSIQMSVLCEASKDACDDLVRAFGQMNGQIAARAQDRH